MAFPATWLDLREPADRQARDGALLRKAATAAGPCPLIVDLGCGTGATMRAMSGLLPGGAHWRMVDSDPDLLARIPAGDGITLHPGDLGDQARLPLDGATMVTASALLDLCPADWIADLAGELATRSLPFYAALTFDGAMEWRPELPGDAVVTAAFNRHQQGDKGLGAASGPEAAAHAVELFDASGFVVHSAPSAWQLGPDQRELQVELLQGIATAAAEAGCEATETWLQSRIAAIAKGACRVGHTDMLALPPRAA
ncbi:class I SAM-dependent methyltransferase [Paracoccus sp. KR1-242]|uniref:class I SAM-dependent methyltransferase n=1 Tax=Paracoccus sp. KR1-242 TaxID=3410028 RepID=UPI003C122D57